MLRQGTTWGAYEQSERFDRVIEYLVMALLGFMPLAFGAVEAWAEQVVIMLAGAICACFFAKAVVTRSSELTWTWTYVPISFFVLVVIVQLLPLPQGVIRQLSPNTLARKTELLNDLAGARGVLDHVTISFYSHATRHDLRLVLAVVAVFVVVFNVYRRPDQIMRLLTAIAIIGGAVALLAIVQNVVGNDKIYWCVSSPHGVAHSGPFVNHSHFGQFMNLSIGAALAVFLVRLRKDFSRRRITPDAVAEYLGSPDARVVWVLAGVMILGAASVFLAMTRGGVIGMLIAAALATLALSLKKPLQGTGWIIAVLALGAFACVLYTGFDAVYDRLTTLQDISRAESGRWQIVKDISVAWTRFPVFGTGLGTHEVVYPMFDRSDVPALSSHAENEYAQTAEETGIAGLLALAAFGVLVAVYYVRIIRRHRLTIASAAYGLGFGLVAILVHSLSDFGQHLPANAMLTAIFCALLIRLSRTVDDRDDETEGRRFVDGPHWYGWIAGLIVVGLLWAWGAMAANDARVAESCWRNVLVAERNLVETEWQGSNEDYIHLLDYAEKAADRQPGNVKYAHWLSVYRWQTISRTTDPNTGQIILSEKGMEFARQIGDDLSSARALCPTFGATWCVLGQLERSVLGREQEGTRHIQKGVELAPCDATARFVAGILALQKGDTEVAGDHLARAVDLDRQLFREVTLRLIDAYDLPDIALHIAGDDISHLRVMAGILEDRGESTEAVKAVREKMLMQLEEESLEPTVPAWVFASLADAHRLDGRLDDAIAHYRLALAKDYGQVDWRYRLAQLLGETGKVRQAVEEAETCLRLRPGHAGAQWLIEKFSSQAVRLEANVGR